MCCLEQIRNLTWKFFKKIYSESTINYHYFERLWIKKKIKVFYEEISRK